MWQSYGELASATDFETQYVTNRQNSHDVVGIIPNDSNFVAEIRRFIDVAQTLRVSFHLIACSHMTIKVFAWSLTMASLFLI